MIGVFALIALLALAASGWFGVRLLLLKRSIRRADQELRAIASCLEENRIVKLPHPDRDLEVLLGSINMALDGIRQQSISYQRREAQFKEQIESISHDLRTPLTSILGYLALVDDGSLDAETRESLATVSRKAVTLQRLIGQFYELSRLQSDDFTLKLQSVDVGRMVRESVASRYRLLSDKGLDVLLHAPEVPVLAHADADALERVLENLLHNVEKYAESQLEISVEAISFLEAPHVRIMLANNVEHLAESNVERLFEPFYAADAARTQESSGLGLAIARQLVERMGGTIEAHLETRGEASWLVFQITLKAD